ncbi:MAG: TrmH family RNA methyltransferase [bacterium]
MRPARERRRRSLPGPLLGRVAFVLGNESTGLSPAVDRLIDRFIALPMAGGVESLNVAIAGAVVAYELCRRRLESRAAVS